MKSVNTIPHRRTDIMTTLFTPCTIGNLKLKNRWAMAPMTRRRCHSSIPTDDVAEHYEKRSKGGIGLIITEGVMIDHPLAGHNDGIPTLKEETMDGWREVIRRCHSHDTKVFPQIWHQGPVVRPGVAAFAVQEDGKKVVREATAGDKEELLQAYSSAAANAFKAGFDGLELHGAHGYLLDSFMRKGDLAYASEVIRETRQQTSPNFPICLRFSNFKVNNYGSQYLNSPASLEKLLKTVIDAGVDFLHPSTKRFWLPGFDENEKSLAWWTRKISDLPTIIVGNIGLKTSEFTADGPESLQHLEHMLKEGEFDLAAVGRPVITEPDWVNKVEVGRWDDILDFYEGSTEEIYP